MDEAWFTQCADELAEALIAARESAAACEALLEQARGRLGPEAERRLLATVAAPAAIARVLMDIMDRPPALVLACAQACHDASLTACRQLDANELPLDAAPAIAALSASAAACRRLLDAAL
ncbi:MAG TPA: hypothetical protein VFJ91_07210 [Gaiellaceae bacterium]|nr:hypothetical protein [Gaiellaceae bacterium]